MFWKPGTAGAPSHQREEKLTIESTSVTFNSNKNLPLTSQRQKLPIFNYRNHFLHLVDQNSVTIVVGETGSGKSTQIPQYLAEANWAGGNKIVAVTQPRRSAVVTIATRVADEMSTHIGSEVGYNIRFESTQSSGSKILFYTDGALLKEIMTDPLLSRFSVIVVDEVHERNINSDLLIALLRKILKLRSDLKVVLTSATTDAEKLKSFFCSSVTGDTGKRLTCSILSVEGRNFPVQVHYAITPVPDYVNASADLSISIHLKRTNGDILVFLTSQEEVNAAVKSTRDRVRKLVKPKQNVLVLPFHGSLPHEEQIRVFDTSNVGHKTRRIIFSTNLAESSVTIPRIVYVIDCGLRRFKSFSVDAALEMVIKAKISKASAVQRAGRAGRLGHGEVYRLYTEDSFQTMLYDTPPDITRSNLLEVILQLKALGISNIVKFNFLTAPPSAHMCKSLEVLHALQAINDKCELTKKGYMFVEFPIDPMLTACLVEAQKHDCTEEVLIIIAMLQVKNIFVKPSGNNKRSMKNKFKFAAREGDLITYLNVYKFFEENNKSKSLCKELFLNFSSLSQASTILGRLKHLCKKYNIEMSSSEDDIAIRKCLTSGLFTNAAYYHHSGVYKTFRDNFSLSIHPTSVLVSERPKYVLFNEVTSSTDNYMRDITVIESDWLLEVASHYYVNKFV